MSPENSEGSTGHPVTTSPVTAGTSGDVISTAPTSGGALEPIPGPADVVERTPTSSEYLGLVADRLDHYRDWDSQHTSIDDPRLSPEQRSRITRRKAWATRLASTPLRSGLSGASTAALYPALDLWSLAIGVTAGVGTGIAARRAVKKSQPVTVEVATEAKRAITDYRESLDALLATASDSKSYVSVSWFESRVDEALLAITSPDVVGPERRKVIDELCEIGARAWALAQLEARHAAVNEASISPVLEALDEVPEGPDFSELDAVASKVAAETAQIATEMGVALPDIGSSTRADVRTYDEHGTLTEVNGIPACGHCGTTEVTYRGETALCRSCANYWTVPTTAPATSTLYCTGTGDDGCACSSCAADEAIEKSWRDEDSMPPCDPCHRPVSDETTWHQRPAVSIEDAAPGAIAAATRALIATGLDWSTDSISRCQTCQGSGVSAYRGEDGKCRRCLGTCWQPGTAQFRAVMAMAEVQAHAILDAADTDEDDYAYEDDL